MQKFGIDISYWQGNYNLNKAKAEGIEFVIIKGGGGDGGGLYKDSKFENNYKKAKGLELPVGAYWFSGAISIEGAVKEAEYFYEKCLKGKQFELPVYMDVEYKLMAKLSKRKLTDIVKVFCNTLEKKGMYVGIYSSLSWYSDKLYDKELKRYAHWVAQWNKVCNYKGEYGVWQFGGETNKIRSNKVAGQVTDQNYLLIDYPTIIKERGLNGFTKSANPKPVTRGLDLTTDFDSAATKAMQRWVGGVQDGEFSGQKTINKPYTPAILTCNYTDGLSYSNSVKSLQNILIKSGYGIRANGQFNYETVKAWQSYLNTKGYKLDVDGIFGAKTCKATKQFLNKVVYGI